MIPLFRRAFTTTAARTMAESAPKRIKTDGTAAAAAAAAAGVLIGTHSGHFHADEAL
ncbi:hypothetical protein MY5147_008898, partial [Beauveria neobassiana]